MTGFPRSGTTLLEQILDAHPEIISVEEQDVMSAEVFPSLQTTAEAKLPVAEVLDRLQPQDIVDARTNYFAWMHSLIGDGVAAPMLIDKNPAMTPMIPVVRRIVPDCKLLIALRDPRDVVLSCYLRYLPLNPVSVSFLELDTTVERYVNDMGAWQRFRVVDDDWLEVRYESLVDDFSGVARSVLAYLGLPWNDAVLGYLKRLEQKYVASPTYGEVAQPIHQKAAGRWRNYADQLAPVLDKLQPVLEQLGYE